MTEKESNKEISDKRWWHIEEYISGRKALIIGKKIQINWYRLDEIKRFSFRWFNSVDMFYWHVVLFHSVLEFQYFYRF